MILSIYCSGNLGNEIVDLIQNGEIEGKWNEICFIDDIRSATEFRGIKVYNYEFFKKKYNERETNIVIATGEPLLRSKLRNKVTRDGYRLTSIIAKNSYIGGDCRIGKGVIVFPFVYISNRTDIGDNNVFHSGAHIIGESNIGNDCFISLGSFVGVYADIGNRVFIGPNASLTDHVKMEDDSVLGIGSTLMGTAEKGMVYVGSPAKCVRENSGKIYK